MVLKRMFSRGSLGDLNERRAKKRSRTNPKDLRAPGRKFVIVTTAARLDSTFSERAFWIGKGHFFNLLDGSM